MESPTSRAIRQSGSGFPSLVFSYLSPMMAQPEWGQEAAHGPLFLFPVWKFLIIGHTESLHSP